MSPRSPWMGRRTLQIMLLSQINWLLVPLKLTPGFLGLKPVITSQAVMIKVVLGGCCQPNQEPWTRDCLRAHGSAFLAMKTGIKICRNRPTPVCLGKANYCGNNSPTNSIVREHKSDLASGMHVPKFRCMFCRGKKWKCTITEYLSYSHARP